MNDKDLNDDELSGEDESDEGSKDMYEKDVNDTKAWVYLKRARTGDIVKIQTPKSCD